MATFNTKKTGMVLDVLRLEINILNNTKVGQ
jgi:hypothetical protein